jgi:hypothetical protein
MEDTVIALHLIAKKIPSQFPNITYIIPHLGGLIPMLLQRLDNQFSMRQRGLPEPPSVTARRFYYDTVGHGSHAALTCAWKAFGASDLAFRIVCALREIPHKLCNALSRPSTRGCISSSHNLVWRPIQACGVRARGLGTGPHRATLHRVSMHRQTRAGFCKCVPEVGRRARHGRFLPGCSRC